MAAISIVLVVATEHVPVAAQAAGVTPRGPASSVVYASESTTTMTIGAPAGTQPGDVLIASLGFGSSIATSQPSLAAPPGWTLVTRVDTEVVGSLAVFWHVFAAGETSYSWTASIKIGGVVFLSAYGGVDTTSPVDVSAGQVTIKAVPIVAPSVTTTAANDLLVASYFGYRSNGGAVSWSPPSGMTELGDASNTRSRSGCVDYVVQGAAGPSGSKLASASAREDYGIAVLTALRSATAPPDTTAPAISGVGAGSVSATGATVTWSTDEPSDSQVDYGTTDSYGSSTALDTTLALVHARALSGLLASTTYHYRVKSRDAAGNLATSADSTFTTSPASDTTPPQIGNVGAGSITSSGATVSWSTDEPSDSQVEYGTTTSYGSSAALDPSPVVAHAQALTGLAPSTSYHYRVNSRDAAGNLATSSDFTFTTTDVPDTTPPVISGVGAGSITSTGATISWTTDEGADSRVEYGTTTAYGASTALDASLVVAHQQSLPGLGAATTYHYRVSSRDAAGNLATSADFTFTTLPPPDTTPPVVSGVAVNSVTASGATTVWTTNEASDSQVEFGLTSSYGSTTSLDPTLVLGHSVALSGLAAGTTYHYRVRSRDAAGNLAISTDFTLTTNASAGGPVPIIVDTDIFSDADDVGALATAFGLQVRGEATVIAIGVNTRTSRPAVATTSWKCAAAIAQFYNSANVPIGTDMPNNGTDTNTVDFTGPCSQLASPSTPSPDTAVNVFRRALVAQPNGSVVMVEVGYQENLSNLLHSGPDSISPLTGADLVSQKVKLLVVMAGRYPSGTGETNLAGNVAAAQDITTNWPTKIVWSGTEVGDAVHTGNTISGVHPTYSPIRVAYEAFVGPNNWIYSYDLTAVYHAVRPGDPLLSESAAGTNTITSGGGNSFTVGAGNQRYLTVTNASSLDSAIEALLDTLPANGGPPTISAVTAGSVTSSGARVTWSTDKASDSQVDYGLTSLYGSTVSSASMVTAHSITLSTLASGTIYHYRVKSRDAAGNLATSGDFTFTTATAAPIAPNDTFDTNTIDPARWTVTQSGSSVAATNQELQVTHPAGAGWTKGGIQSVGAYDITGGCTQVQVKRAANDGLGGATYGETTLFLWVDSTHYVEFFIAGGAMTAWVNNGSGEVNLTPSWPRYSATSMQWLRFRESAGVLYLEYASGASSPGTWTVLASMADPFALTSVTLKIVAGSNVAAADTARFDNISSC